MYGMMCVLYTTGAWLLLASYLELPVSTGHSTTGGLIGMVMAYGGADCIVWYEESDSFPYLKGVAAMVPWWVLSPMCAGVVSMLFFLTARTFILRSSHAFDRSFWVFPILVMFTITVNGEFRALIERGEGDPVGAIWAGNFIWNPRPQPGLF